MQPPQQRPSTHVPSTYATSIPTTQIQALDRRHLLDQQQRAFQGNHSASRDTVTRRRPPA
ncbi:MAG: hypothetical protein ABSH35_28480 [Isosphaeraceae bacterium]|jgi:hypothetical protein